MTNSIMDELALKKERWYIIILAAIQIVHILDFVIMMPLGPRFMRVFHISPNEFSTLVSAYTFSAGIVGFLGALYADHFDRKKFLLFNFTGFIFGTFMCARGSDFSSLLSARIIAGAFGGMLNANVLSLVSDLIPFQRRGTAMGVVMSAFSITSVFGIPVGLHIANVFDWQMTFYFICFIAVIFWILSLFILPSIKVRNTPKSFTDNFKNFKSIVFQKAYHSSFLLTSLLGFSLFIVIPFISPYMVKNVGMTEEELPLIYFIGGIFTIISARFIGKFCDKLGSFKIFRIVALLSILPVVAMTNLPYGTPLWLCLAATTLFTMSGSGRFIPALTIVSAVVKSEDRGTFMNLENALRQLSSGLAAQAGGLIIATTITGSLSHYHIVGFISVIVSLVALYIASIIKTNFNLR
jgi:predicted MFS family arabinose efflux permease